MKARALLGGYQAWVDAGGETEPAGGGTNAVTQQNNETQQQQVIASPNPTIDDSKSSAADGPGKVEATKVQATKAASEAPMQPTTTRSRSRSKQRRTRPRND